MGKRTMLLKKSKLAEAVVLATVTGAAAVTAPSHAAVIEEVIVTATKRSESLQDVAIAIQTLGQEQLEEFNVANFDDYIRYIPSVNSAGRGPGQSSIFIRGIATDSSDQTSVEIGQPVPNVALYLDEQPVSSGGRNLDVYVADIERVEVLPGPQGTLFGASSQAGTVRLITNKPVLDEFSVGVDTGIAFTHEGEASNNVEAVFNVPLLENTLAVRGVFYNAFEGGYIDNVYGENAYLPGDEGFPDGATSKVVNNAELVEEDFNDTRYTGFRLGAKYAPTDNIDILAQYMSQQLQVDGVFDHSPQSVADYQEPGSPRTGRVVGDLKVQRFFRDELEDDFNQFSLTATARMDALDIVYAGSFLDREVDNSFDYSGYTAVGEFGYYYICQPTYTACGDPTQGVVGDITNERQTHELRVNSTGDGRFSYVAGVFFDDIETKVDIQFHVPASVGYFAPNAPISDSTINNPNPRAPGVTFVSDNIRTEEQLAFFGELGFEIIPDTLKLSVGARQYEIESSLVGSTNFATLGDQDGDGDVDADDDRDGGRNLDAEFAGQLPLKEDDTIGKATLEFTPNEDMLFYITWSEGFRPGGFNRTDDDLIPKTYKSDEVTNTELGWKLTLLDGSLRFNASLYQIDWEGMQVGITDVSTFPPITYTTNAADAEITGFEGDVVYAVNDNLTLFAAYSYNDTEMTRVPENVTGIAPEGSQLALAPELQYNLRARYEFEMASMSPYFQLVYAFTDDQYSSVVDANRFRQKSYETFDASTGVELDNWSFELYMENITDERAQLFVNSLDTDVRITTNRPRTFGLKMSYDF